MQTPITGQALLSPPRVVLKGTEYIIWKFFEHLIVQAAAHCGQVLGVQVQSLLGRLSVPIYDLSLHSILWSISRSTLKGRLQLSLGDILAWLELKLVFVRCLLFIIFKTR